MTSFLCEYSRALLERAIEGGYNFADCMITPDGCSMMNRAVENMELLKTMGKDKPKFFFEYMEIPMKADDNGLNLYVLQCRNHILTPLHDVYGIDVSDAAIRKAVAEHNRVCELIRAIGEYRKGPNPRITGYEFHVIILATYVAPKYLLIDKLEETLKELKTRRPDKKNPYRARVVVVGSESMILTSSSSSRRPAPMSVPTASATVRSRSRPDHADGRRGRADPDLPTVHEPRPVPALHEHVQDDRPPRIRQSACQGVRG